MLNATWITYSNYDKQPFLVFLDKKEETWLSFTIKAPIA